MSELTDALNRIVSWLEKHPSEKYAFYKGKYST